MRQRILTSVSVFLSLLAVAAFLFGIIPTFHPTADQLTLAGSLIGAVGTIFAGWIAWMAVQAQIGAEKERHQNDIVIERIANADAISALLILASVHLERDKEQDLDNYIVPTCVGMLVAIMQIDPRLGTGLGGFVRDAEYSARQSIKEKDTDGWGRRALAFRARLLGEACQTASRRLEANRSVSAAPLLKEELVRSLSAKYHVADQVNAAITWCKLLTQERQVYQAAE